MAALLGTQRFPASATGRLPFSRPLSRSNPALLFFTIYLACAGSRIRTCVAMRRQIYSLVQLTALPSQHFLKNFLLLLFFRLRLILEDFPRLLFLFLTWKLFD